MKPLSEMSDKELADMRFQVWLKTATPEQLLQLYELIDQHEVTLRDRERELPPPFQEGKND